jgi:hypothetical protein
VPARPRSPGLPIRRQAAVLETPRSTAPAAFLVLAASAAGAASFELPAVKAQAPPSVDGVIDEREWDGAARARNFIQYEPRRGEASPVATEALVLYDATHLYVAFRALDPEPITAQLTQRDADLFGDDAVIVVLDSSHDRQSAFYFMTNPLGTQADGRIAEDGRVRDPSWDAPWRSAARRDGEGWTAEMAIPLPSIKYAAGEKVTWGLNLGRSRRRSLEISFWAGPLDNRDRVSQAGRLVGLNVAPPVDQVQVVPHVLSQLQEGARAAWDAGVDARYALTSQLAAYATVNPDFATIEADQETVNLTRFELSLAEKRQFFLEGQELFRQRIQTFYSRRIEDLRAGGKLLGRTGPWTLALFGANAEPSGGGARAFFTVARAQRDLGRSLVAATLANRRRGGLDEGSLGVDTTLFFTKTLGFTGQLIESYGRYGRGTLAFFLRPAFDSPTGHFHLRYTHLGDRFRDNANAVGFIRDDDRREADSAVERTLWLKRGPLERLGYDSNYRYWSQRGRLRSWEVRQSLEADFRNRLSAEVSWIGDMQRFEKKFRNHRAGFALGYNTREYQSVEAELQFGRNFDADFRLWTLKARRKLSDRLAGEPVLHEGPVPEGLLPDQQRHRPPQPAGRLRLSLPAALRDGAGRLPARDRGARRALGTGPHGVRQADDGVLSDDCHRVDRTKR